MAEPQPLPKVFVVRLRDFNQEHDGPVFSDGRMDAVFSRREDAETFLAQQEEASRRAGYLEPLFYLQTEANLLNLTAFEAGVFHDFLQDADIPDPPANFWFSDGEHYAWWKWLRSLTPEQAVHLCAALHKLRYHEIIELDLIEGAYPTGLRDEYETPPPPWARQPALPDENIPF